MANVALSSHFRDFFVCSDFTECLETTLVPIVMKQLGLNKLSYLLNSVESYNLCSNSYNERLFGVNESIEDKYLNIVSKANKFASNLINDTLTNVSLNNLVNKESVSQGKHGLVTVNNNSNTNKQPQFLNSLDSLSITNALNNLYNSSKQISKHGIDISNEVSIEITIKYRKYVHDLLSAIEKNEESFKELNKDLITTRLNLIKDQNTYINNSEKLIQFKRDNYLEKEIFNNFERNLNLKKLNNRIKLIDFKIDSTDININVKGLKIKPINKLDFFDIINKMIISIKTEKLKQTSSLPFSFNSKLVFQFKGCDFYDYCKKNLISDFDLEGEEEGEVQIKELDEEIIKSFGDQLISLKLVKPPNSISRILNSSTILYQWTDLAYYLSGNIIQSRVDLIYEDDNMYEVNDNSNNNVSNNTNTEETANEGNELTKIFKKLNVSSGDLINQTIGLTNPNLSKSTLSLVSNTNSIDSISNNNINNIDYEFKQLYLIMKKSNDKYIESLLKYDEEVCKFEESMFDVCNFLEFKYFEIKKQVKVIINEFFISYGHHDSILKLNDEINIESNEDLFEFFKYENDLRQRKYLPTIHVYETYPSNFKSIKQIFGIDLPKLCLLHNTKIPIIIIEIINRINKNFNIHQKFEIWNNKLSKKNDLTDILEIRNRINNIFLNNTNNSDIVDTVSEAVSKSEKEGKLEEQEGEEHGEGHKQEHQLREYYYNDYQNFARQINIILDSLKPNLLGLLIKRYLLELPDSLIKRSAIIAFNELFDETDEESKESLNFDKAFKNFYNEFNEKELKIFEKGNEENINEINILNDFEFFNKNLLGCLLHHWNEIINEIDQELNNNNKDNDNGDNVDNIDKNGFFNSDSKDEFIKSLACNYVSVILKPNNDEDEFLRDEYCFTFFKKLIECYKK
ncbi:hypothetical protein B5S33_g1690 [[Candida] boidinii]|nr:hypothetical protein B5S33_g1690 [[Candida] boidinii]